MDTARRIVAAYRWQRALGLTRRRAAHSTLVVTPATPDVWDANYAAEVDAASPEEIADVFAALDQAYAFSRYRVVQTDPFTSPRFTAELAMRDYSVWSTTLLMTLDAPVLPPPAVTRGVTGEADWQALAPLVHANHAEFPPEIADGLIASYRAKASAMRFHFVEADGAPAAYGAAIVCPDGVGMIEHLFTLPEHRRLGIASALVARLADALAAQGCGTIFLGARAEEAPKHLYHRLGFRPVALTHGWLKLP